MPLALSLVPPTAHVPPATTSFVGREREVGDLTHALTAARLVTLTGAGGSGKTRVAAEVARRVEGSFPDGVAWIELAPLSEPTMLVGHIAASLGVGSIGQSPADSLRDALRDAELLLVLDNCEHLVDAVAAAVDRLLRDASRLRVLATSREALGIPGERAWLIPVLSLPNAEENLDRIAASESVRLFVDRAKAASRAFELTSDNAADVARLCRRLDGLPLAIELAAARSRTATPNDMLAMLDVARDDRGEHDRAGARHRTLRDAIDWSYRLLDAREQIALQRLSIFAGELSLEAAEAVCAADDVEPDDVLDLVAALVDKSLVVSRDQVDESRYHLLETIRQYAREHLDTSAEANNVRARHARFYAELVRESEPHLITPARPERVKRLSRELDDLRLALEWTRANDPPLHVEIAGRLGWFWYSSGLWTEGRRRIEDALKLSAAQEPTLARAQLLFAGGVIASLQGQGAIARHWLEESSSIAAASGDFRLVAYSDSYMGVALGQEGQPAAEAPTRAALAWFDQAGDLYGKRLALVVLATLQIFQKDLLAAYASADEGVRVARTYGLGRELGIALQVYGTVLLHRRQIDAAAQSMAHALRALRDDPQPFWLARALELMAVVECVAGRPLVGARLLGAAEARRERVGAVMFRLDRERIAPFVEAGRAADDRAFSAAWAQGRAASFEDVVAEAIDRGTDLATAPSPRAPSQPDMLATTPAWIRVRALGALDVERDGDLLNAQQWTTARMRELLAYLLVHRDGRTREQIATDFWPDASAAQAKNAFHVLLHHLRRSLGRRDVIVYSDDVYCVNWSLGVETDVDVFEREVTTALREVRASDATRKAVALERLREALTLYRDDFLAGESAGDWHLAHRDRLQRLWVEALRTLGKAFVASDAHDDAAAVYRQLLRADELDEDSHRQLMATLARSGQRGEALRHYDRLTLLLEKELGASPQASTTALYDRLRRAEPV
jgi:predicted ATPase/DNA-binding SARP family transcriptional activator